MESRAAMMRLLAIGACAMMANSFGTVKTFDPVVVEQESAGSSSCPCYEHPSFLRKTYPTLNSYNSFNLQEYGFKTTERCITENAANCVAEVDLFREAACSGVYFVKMTNGVALRFSNSFVDSYKGILADGTTADPTIRTSYVFCDLGGGVGNMPPPSPPPTASDPKACNKVQSRENRVTPSMKRKRIKTYRTDVTAPVTQASCGAAAAGMMATMGITGKKNRNRFINKNCDNIWLAEADVDPSTGDGMLFVHFCTANRNQCVASNTESSLRYGRIVANEEVVDCA